MLLDPFRCIVDFSFYREAAKKSPGRIAGYLAYLGLLFAVSATAALYLKVSPMLQETVEWAGASIPTLTLAKGKLSSTAPGPVRVQHPRVPQVAILVDTNRTTPVTLQEMVQEKVVVFLTQGALYLAPTEDRIEAYDLSKAANPQPVTLDASFFKMLGNALPKILYPLSFLTTWLLFFFWKLAAACVYSVVALILNAIVSGGLEYPELLKLSVYAQTPVILLQAVQMFLPSPIPFFTLLSLLVVGVYLWQAIRQNAATPPAPLDV